MIVIKQRALGQQTTTAMLSISFVKLTKENNTNTVQFIQDNEEKPDNNILNLATS